MAPDIPASDTLVLADRKCISNFRHGTSIKYETAHFSSVLSADTVTGLISIIRVLIKQPIVLNSLRVNFTDVVFCEPFSNSLYKRSSSFIGFCIIYKITRR